jgi:hypothetical protein
MEAAIAEKGPKDARLEDVAERPRGGPRPGAGAPPGNDNRWKSRRREPAE